MMILVAAATIASTPLPVLAQSWPTTVASGAATLAPKVRTLVLDDRGVVAGDRQTRPRATAASVSREFPDNDGTGPALGDPDERNVPDVDIRAKEVWSQDEGFRFTGSRVAFKRRF